MNKYWKEILLGVIFIFIILPGIIALSMNIRLICTDTSNEWIGFWGGYLGSIVGAIATIGGVYITIRSENEKRAKEEAARERDIKEQHRLSIMPNLSRYYHFPKTDQIFQTTESYFVDFRGNLYIYNDIRQCFRDEIENPTEENYLLNYKVQNIGLGSAAELYIKIDDNYIIRNGGINPNSAINLCLLFKSEDLDNRKIKIEFNYSDVSCIEEYYQYEELCFKKSNKPDGSMISLVNISSLSRPQRKTVE